jgi:TusA-related sulfurtransferase
LKKIVLDAREMEHPTPLQLALKYLKDMDKNEYLYMIHRKNPIPLIEIVKDKGYLYLTQNYNDTWHILISKKLDCNLKEFLDV